jgi:hypothetical protein
MEISPGSTAYDALKRSLARGWNTWNTRSVLSHVLLPEGIAVNLGIKEYRERSYLKETLIGRRGESAEVVIPGPRSYDGRYTDVTVRWKDITLRVQSATEGEDLLLLVTPLASQVYSPATLVVEGGVLWNRDGCVRKVGKELRWETPEKVQTIRPAEGQQAIPVHDPYIPTQGCYLSYTLNVGEAIALHTGSIRRSRASIESVMRERQAEQEQYVADRFGELAETYRAMQTCLAWDTVYDPLKDRVISPVSRIWNCGWGGYVLFCWDTYFAAAMAAIDNRDLAYANAIEITREITESGFVPNFATSATSRVMTAPSRRSAPWSCSACTARSAIGGCRDCCSTTFCAGTGGGIQRGAKANFFAGGPTRTYRASARTSRRRRWITRLAR